jgi:hypothetical protein
MSVEQSSSLPRNDQVRQTQQRHWTVVFAVLVLAIPVTIGLWITGVHHQAKRAPDPTCRAVAAALSDGPDPSADPVGYAEAQVLPLRHITTSDKPLQSALDTLSSAYASFYKSNGSPAALQRVRAATTSVNSFCPGAAS